MKKIMGLTAAASAVALLAACGGMESDMAPMSSNAFNQTLDSGYQNLASSEQAEYDWADSRHFAQKGVDAGSEQVVEPDTFDFRDIPVEHQDELNAARVRLLSALGKGAADSAPVEVATAQIMFDCWMQEQEENHQPTDIAQCRTGYESAMLDVDNIIGSPSVGPYNVFFDFDQANLSGDASALLATILGDISKRPDAKVVVSGHADTSGASDYNFALSQERADAVAAYLAANGVPAGSIDKVPAGETGLLVPTADGVQNAQNRRAFIVVE